MMPLFFVSLRLNNRVNSRVSFQLTFTPTWGKRDPGSSLSGGSSGGTNPQMMYTGGSAETNCKTSMESLLMIYRLIQTEAQRIMACNGK